jgi:hypothetical protein
MLGDQQHRLVSVIVVMAILTLLGLLDLADRARPLEHAGKPRRQSRNRSEASPTVRRGRRPGGPGTLAEQSGSH